MWLAAAACAGPPDAPEESYPPVRLRMLTDAEHANAIRDLVGPVELPEVRTPGVAADQFVHPVDLYDVRGPLLAQYHDAARLAASQAAARLDDLVACAATGGDRDCAGQLIDRLAPRAFRRPLDAGDRAALLAVYDRGAVDGFESGAALVIEAILAAPDFLYREELGEPGIGAVALAPHEIAEALSFTLLESIPDEPLWAAAVDGSLASPAVIAEQVDRLLATPRVRERLGRLIQAWLRVPAVRRLDAARIGSLDVELRDSMATETALVVADVIARGASLAELLTTTRTFVDARLAEHYGIEGVAAGDGFVPVELDPEQRSGVLTHAGLLSLLSSPKRRSIVSRGRYINQLLVCQPDPPPPPLELLEQAADDIRGLDERELAEYRTTNPDCAGCHQGIDPWGIALDRYNRLGQWRPDGDANTAVEIDGRVEAVAGARELARLLIDSDTVAACVVDQYVAQAFGGPLIGAPTTRRRLIERFATSGLDLVDLVRAIATSVAFRKRVREAAP